MMRGLTWTACLAAAWIYLTGIEGRLFPAAGEMQLVGAFSTRERLPEAFDWQDLHRPGPYTVFWIRSERLRPKCDFERFDWRLGPRGERSVPVRINDNLPVLHPDGVFSAGPWTAEIGLEAFHRTHADVLHRCKIFGIPLPWLTRTQWWN